MKDTVWGYFFVLAMVAGLWSGFVFLLVVIVKAVFGFLKHL